MQGWVLRSPTRISKDDDSADSWSPLPGFALCEPRGPRAWAVPRRWRKQGKQEKEMCRCFYHPRNSPFLSTATVLGTVTFLFSHRMCPKKL